MDTTSSQASDAARLLALDPYDDTWTDAAMELGEKRPAARVTIRLDPDIEDTRRLVEIFQAHWPMDKKFSNLDKLSFQIAASIHRDVSRDIEGCSKALILSEQDSAWASRYFRGLHDDHYGDKSSQADFRSESQFTQAARECETGADESCIVPGPDQPTTTGTALSGSVVTEGNPQIDGLPRWFLQQVTSKSSGSIFSSQSPLDRSCRMEIQQEALGHVHAALKADDPRFSSALHRLEINTLRQFNAETGRGCLNREQRMSVLDESQWQIIAAMMEGSSLGKVPVVKGRQPHRPFTADLFTTDSSLSPSAR